MNDGSLAMTIRTTHTVATYRTDDTEKSKAVVLEDLLLLSEGY